MLKLFENPVVFRALGKKKLQFGKYIQKLTKKKLLSACHIRSASLLIPNFIVVK
jgi:hypothetical protein